MRTRALQRLSHAVSLVTNAMLQGRHSFTFPCTGLSCQGSAGRAPLHRCLPRDGEAAQLRATNCPCGAALLGQETKEGELSRRCLRDRHFQQIWQSVDQDLAPMVVVPLDVFEAFGNVPRSSDKKTIPFLELPAHALVIFVSRTRAHRVLSRSHHTDPGRHCWVPAAAARRICSFY